MTDSTVLLDPTAELSPAERERLPRPDSLQGRTIALLNISKARGDVFLERLGELMAEQGMTIRHYQKPTFARVIPLDLLQQIAAESDVVIEALAD